MEALPSVPEISSPELTSCRSAQSRHPGAQRGPTWIPARLSGPSCSVQRARTPALGKLKLPARFEIFWALLFVKGAGKDLCRSPDYCIWCTTAGRLALSAASLKARPGEERKTYKPAGLPAP